MCEQNMYASYVGLPEVRGIAINTNDPAGAFYFMARIELILSFILPGSFPR